MDANVYKLRNDLIEQRLDARDAAKLNELLRSDPEVKALYRRMLGIHQELVNREAPVRPFSVAELQAVRAVAEHFGNGTSGDALDEYESDAHEDRANSKNVLEHGRFRIGMLGLVFATAASVLVAIAWFYSWGARGDHAGQVAFTERTATGSAAAPPADVIVARITKKVDCDWQDSRWSVAPSASIAAGQQINLAGGLLVIEFNSGAELTLDGPATLVATSDMSAQLLVGKLSARVPPRGRGFKVETYAGDFVDLGTEFGMIVSDDGLVETHVFKGKVIAEPTLSGTGSPQNVALETGAAWARPASGVVHETRDAEPGLFMLPTIPDDGRRLDPPRYLGSHYEREGFGFTGDIAEIMVFDTALSMNESLVISNWLAEKYGIVLPGQ